MHLILMDHAPGIQLDKKLFWSLSREERDRVRGAFRLAWLNCVATGLLPDLSNLVWDAQHLLYSFLVGFQEGFRVTPSVHRSDAEWIYWNLAECLRIYDWVNETEAYPDKSGWTL
ncbi:uncharacterized protein BDV17DRAFT_101543 [Aspergillus undulatus]|uniref:uncharacterized protein n=1 Tax=Aspergillus undulatus TaxID=1810928 RepID=UPI003CCDD367